MADLKLRRVHFPTEIDLKAELERLGVSGQDLDVARWNGGVVFIRLSGLEREALQSLKEHFRRLGGGCVVGAEGSGQSGALLCGTRYTYSELLSWLASAASGMHGLARALRFVLTEQTTKPTFLDCRGRRLDYTRRTLIMGIINCTPDSFYAGSRVQEVDAAVAAGVRMAAEGADLLDIGGESTRPGSEPVSVQEEIDRVLPVIEKLHSQVEAAISIDTYKARVAEAALEAGANMVNDISGLRFDPEMAECVRRYEAAIVVMHIKGRPRDMQQNPEYRDLMAELHDYFAERISFCESHGISRERIILDPGIGFGKRYEHNYEILRRLRELSEFSQAVLIGPSRKSFLGAALGLPPEERLEGTAAAVTIGIQNGADIVRVHDVAEMARVARVADLLAGKSQLGEGS